MLLVKNKNSRSRGMANQAKALLDITFDRAAPSSPTAIKRTAVDGCDR